MTAPTAPWTLLAQWGPRPVTADDQARALARTVIALHNATSGGHARARFWLDTDDMMTVCFDAADTPDGTLDASRRLVDEHGVTLGLSLASQDHPMERIDEEQPLSLLDIDLGNTETGTVNVIEWNPHELTEDVLAAPLTAETTLRELVTAWDPDAAAWTRSDLDRTGRLAGPNGPIVGWITYLADTGEPDMTALVRAAATLPTAQPFHRGVLISADRPAGRFEFDDAATLARILTATNIGLR